MKILFLSAWYPHPTDNGSKIRVLHLLRSLAERHEVTLAAFVFGTAAPAETDEVHRACRRVHLLPLDPIQRSRMSTLRTFLSLTPSAARSVQEMHALVRKIAAAGRFDAVIASTTTMSAYALDVPAIRIIEEHNALSRWMYERYTAQTSPVQRVRCWVSWQKARRFEGRLYRQFDQVTVVSEQDRRTLQSVLGRNAGRVAVIPNGTDPRHNRPGLAQPAPDRLVFNGSLTYSANYDAMRWFLGEVYPHVKACVPGVSLTITGATQGVDLAGLALDESVHLTGFVEDVRLPVAEAAVAVAPIRQGGGTRLKILEAMALGTPVVSTSKGAEGIDAIDDEHLLLADDPQPFASRTLELLCNPALRGRLAANARRLVEERYDWSAIGRRFTALVEETVARRQTLPPPKG